LQGIILVLRFFVTAGKPLSQNDVVSWMAKTAEGAATNGLEGNGYFVTAPPSFQD
jgi:hypothetical protein